MCLAVPGRVIELAEEAGLRTARVDFGGVRKGVCVETLPDVRVGAWVLVHAGVALQELDEDAARETLALLGADGSDPEATP